MYWCCVVANTPIFALFNVLSVVTHTLQVHCAISSAVCSLACSVHWECLGLGFMQRWTDRLLCTLPRPAVSSNAHFHLLCTTSTLPLLICTPRLWHNCTNAHRRHLFYAHWPALQSPPRSSFLCRAAGSGFSGASASCVIVCDAASH